MSQSPLNHKVVRFGLFELDLEGRELRKAGLRIKLGEQPFQVLVVLLEHPGQIVTREELQHRLWPEDTFVDFDLSLNAAVKKLRQALGDDSHNPKFVETLYRRGYRFIGAVNGAASHPEQDTFAARDPAESAAPETIPVAAPAPARRRWKWPAVVAASVLAAFIAVYFVSRASARKLTYKDTIVLADFNNTTGDPVFDGTLRQGLSSQLEQSPFLNLLSDQRIAQTLVLMEQPRDARLTGKLTDEACQRTASAATIEGSISNLGNDYVLGLKAVNCRNGDLLVEEQVTANGKEQVLKALGEAATRLRQKLGESLTSVQKYDVPLENVTTSSLEALQAYSIGYQMVAVKADFPAARPFFQRAISLDPNFAMAYALLGTNFRNAGELALAGDNTRKAYELRERVSERERLYITSHYAAYVTGDIEESLRAYEMWTQAYPRDDEPYPNLGNIYYDLGDYDKALAAYQESVRLNPERAITGANLVLSYIALNRLDEAKAAVQDMQAHKLESPVLHVGLYALAFLQHDRAGMEREAARLMDTSGWEDAGLQLESETAAYGGQFAKARELARRAVDFAQRTNKERAAGLGAEAALQEIMVGNKTLARQRAEAALALSTGRDVAARSAMVMTLASDVARAKQLVDDLGRRYPEDTLVQFRYLPAIRAGAALQKGDAAGAVANLALTARYDFAKFPGPTSGAILFPIYLRGQAFLAERNAAAATAEFQKILDHPGVVRNALTGALAHLGLGRAYALSGDTTKARTAYQDFFTLWKNADPDVLILKQAKAEYAKLN
jgi:DNA-binding winged helix-turn-helix (wHTH) protein/Flp pilus assembly protein TadD